MTKGGFKFSRGQFNNIRYLEGPEELKQKTVALTASYYVRNKIGTVVPFPFKNLTECIQVNYITDKTRQAGWDFAKLPPLF